MSDQVLYFYLEHLLIVCGILDRRSDYTTCDYGPLGTTMQCGCTKITSKAECNEAARLLGFATRKIVQEPGRWMIYHSKTKMNYADAVSKCSDIGATLVGKDAVDEVRFDDYYNMLTADFYHNIISFLGYGLDIWQT